MSHEFCSPISTLFIFGLLFILPKGARCTRCIPENYVRTVPAGFMPYRCRVVSQGSRKDTINLLGSRLASKGTIDLEDLHATVGEGEVLTPSSCRFVIVDRGQMCIRSIKLELSGSCNLLRIVLLSAFLSHRHGKHSSIFS